MHTTRISENRPSLINNKMHWEKTGENIITNAKGLPKQFIY